MQVNSPAASRAAWYDRNPTSEVKTAYSNRVSPHSTTTRWSYTIPAARKAIIEIISGYTYRDTAATTGAEYGINISFVPNATTGAAISNINVSDNTEGAYNYVQAMGAITMFSGDSLIGDDFDNSTGGTVSYVLSMKGTEYDA